MIDDEKRERDDETGAPDVSGPSNDSAGDLAPKIDSGGAWARESFAALLAMAERGKAEAEAHVANCTDRPCERCERYVCKCGAPVDGAKSCRSCDLRGTFDRLLRVTRKSVPPRFRWSFDVTPNELLERVQASPELVRRALTQPPSTSLVFYGGTGTGKTSLACAMLDAWVRLEPGKRTGAIFVQSSDLSRARARYKLGADEAPEVTQAMTCPLLLLDELGGRGENDRDGCITDVVWARTNAELPIWVTCGLGAEGQTPEQFAEVLAKRYDGGFVRRLLDHGKRVQLGRKP
jgi:hypothetical protein